MSGAEQAFFASTVLTALALAWAMRSQQACWLWWSGVPHAVLLDAPIAASALAALGVAGLLTQGGRREPSSAPKQVQSHLPRLGLVALLVFVLLGTWARQIVTAGVTPEEAPAFGELGWLLRDAGPSSSGGATTWIALVACALLVGAAWAGRHGPDGHGPDGHGPDGHGPDGHGPDGREGQA